MSEPTDFRTPVIDRLGAQLADLIAENARLRQERDKLKADTERLARRLAVRYEETTKARAEVEWMRPVVEAAEAWQNFRGSTNEIMVALNAWRAAQTDQKGPPDGLSAPVGDERAVGEGEATDGTEAQGRARWPEDDLEAPDLTVKAHRIASLIDAGLGNVTRPAPADPAGLDAAIEASGGLGGLLSHAEAAQILRAAAPHIRRAVLLEAADDLAAMGTAYIGADWLRERAEREATNAD